MKKIRVLIWEGLRRPTDPLGADMVIHEDPSDETHTLCIMILNPDLLPDLEKIFPDEIMESFSEKEFDTQQDIDAIKEELVKVFSVSFIESEMTPLFINGGGRKTTENGYPLN